MVLKTINIEEWYQKYGPMVLRRCRKLLRNEEKAMDAMQDVFVRVLRYQHRLEPKYPSNLLLRMATNICLNIIRDNPGTNQWNCEDILEKIACYDDREDRMIFNQLLDKIFNKEKKSTREIAVMHFVDGMTLKEVATEVGLSVSGVRKRIRQLRARIQTEEVHYEQ